MQPDVRERFDAIRQQRILGVILAATSKAASGWRASRIAVQPFDDAAGKRLRLGLARVRPPSNSAIPARSSKRIGSAHARIRQPSFSSCEVDGGIGCTGA